MSAIRSLSVVEPGDEVRTPHKVRHDLAVLLRKAITVVERGRRYNVGNGSERDPVAAGMLVLFSADGEPTIFTVGFDGDRWKDRTEWFRLTHDISGVIHAMRIRPVAGEGAKPGPVGRYESAHNWWLNQEQRREVHARRDQADADRLAAEKPWLCDCGTRCRTAAGLRQHQNGRPHQLWASRAEASR